MQNSFEKIDSKNILTTSSPVSFPRGNKLPLFKLAFPSYSEHICTYVYIYTFMYISPFLYRVYTYYII